jgi:hypothetical protein
MSTIITNTFKVFNHGIELRVYVPDFDLSQFSGLKAEVVGLIARTVCGPERSPADGRIKLASNRAGLHFAFYWQASEAIERFNLTSPADFNTTLEAMSRMRWTLLADGWKESKSN